MWGNSNVAIFFQKGGEALHEIVELGHMREHVIGDHKIGLPSVFGQPKSDLFAKEFFYDFDTLGAGGEGRAMCRLHAVARYPALAHELQQIPVIGCDLHHA
jgi:hypothetical protein